MPPPNMTVFDAESREVCSVRRQASNTPLQALNLLNDVTYVEAARHLAYRILSEAGQSTTDRLTYAMELVTTRLPSPEELAVIERGLNAILGEYRQNPKQAAELLTHGESEVPGNHNPVEHAAWTQLALMLFNLDEAMTRQ